MEWQTVPTFDVWVSACVCVSDLDPILFIQKILNIIDCISHGCAHEADEREANVVFEVRSLLSRNSVEQRPAQATSSLPSFSHCLLSIIAASCFADACHEKDQRINVSSFLRKHAFSLFLCSVFSSLKNS